MRRWDVGKDQVGNSLPGITRIIVSPAKISALALEDDRRVKGSTVRTNTFDDCDEIAIAAVDLLNRLLVAVNKDLDLVADAELDALHNS
jgi:hypothetical protein